MKTIIRYFKLLIFFICLFTLGLFAFLNYNMSKYGPDFIQAKLSESLGQNVFIGRVAYIPPFGGAAYDVVLEDDSQIHTLKVHLDIKEFVQGRLRISKVVVYRPDFIVSSQMLSFQNKMKKAAVSESKQLSGLFTQMNDFGSERCQISKLLIVDGKMRYSKVIRNMMGLSRSSRKTFDLENFELVAKNFTFPLNAERVPFYFQSRFTENTTRALSLSDVKGKGWIDFVGKNMDAVLDIVRPDGQKALSAKVVSQDNQMFVKGQVDHKTYSSGVKDKMVQMDEGFSSLLDSVLSSVDIDDIIDFSFKTQMDKPRIGKVYFSGGLAKSWP